MSIAQPKKNSRKPELALGTRVANPILAPRLGERCEVIGVRRPKFAKRYTLRCCDDCAPFNARRDALEVVG